DVALKKDRRAGEEPLRPRSRRLESLAQLVGIGGHAHADAATAGGGLDHDRVADGFRFLEGLLHVLDRVLGAGGYRDAGFGHEVARTDLVTHLVDRLWRGADPGQSRVD